MQTKLIKYKCKNKSKIDYGRKNFQIEKSFISISFYEYILRSGAWFKLQKLAIKKNKRQNIREEMEKKMDVVVIRFCTWYYFDSKKTPNYSSSCWNLFYIRLGMAHRCGSAPSLHFLSRSLLSVSYTCQSNT